ncbi:efflux RND transporter periplasmic adaptor subunit [Paraferrimonas sp. SM1919]|uniref:efflux RND transporter periplasmic adaptor subunit n=1 Tax=Paraferrimonas sp. SM1919 TaxID=2662263 RepID=UPI0013D842C6|nr:HlyD family efflux transporter periplasmic adaptor subunit [Paraferrimonas sp. SM1919]
MFSKDEQVTLNTESSQIASYTEQGPWAELAAAKDITSFAQQWLNIQSSMLIGVQSALVIYRVSAVAAFDPNHSDEATDENSFVEIAHWPEQGYQQALSQDGSAELALQKSQPVIKKYQLDDSQHTFVYHLAYPIKIDQRDQGVVVFRISAEHQAKLASIMRQLQWGAVWFEVFTQKHQHQKAITSNQDLEKLTLLLAAYVDTESYQQTALMCVNRIANDLGLERVSFGFLVGQQLQLEAISNCASFDEKTNLVKAIIDSLQECSDQQASVIYPQQQDFKLTEKHQLLVEQHGSGSVLSVPIFEVDSKRVSQLNICGAMLFEHNQNDFFDAQKISYCQQTVRLIGPLLLWKKKQDRNLWQVLIDAGRNSLFNIFGFKYLKAKFILASLALVIVLAGVFETQYKVHANATVEGWLQRSIAAPQDGYIKAVNAFPGDLVDEGKVLFELDDNALQLELLKWQSEHIKLKQEYLDAFANYDKTKVGILKARIAQVEANLELVSKHISKSKVATPFAGIVVAGDLSQSMGAPVQKGDILMQIAPLDKYRVILHIDEKQIRQINLGQSGTLVLSSMPGQGLNFTVKRLTPMAEVVDGQNIFKVEAELDEAPQWLRPGMQGAGKVEIEQRSYLWIATRNFVHWFKLWFWSAKV